MGDYDEEELKATQKFNQEHSIDLEEYIREEIERINRIIKITPIDLGMRYAYENILKIIWKGEK